MEVAKTTDSGYQLFDPSMLQRAIAIRKLQKERLTLDEIKMKLLT
jgi:DNA-binding transcriptional MerR regulator